MNKNIPFYYRDSFLYFFAISASILLSCWIDWHETVINPDAICYLLSAETMGQGLHKAMHLCGQAQWPFYSILIYAFVAVSHFSYTFAAYLLDGIFSFSSVVLFILIVKELGGSRRVLWFAALVILLSHDFNGVRVYIIRDHGFWTFYLASLFFLLRYFKQPALKLACAFGASLLSATLFRIEGAMFLLLLPFLALFHSHYPFRKRLQFFLSLNLLTVITCIAILTWLLFHPQQSLSKLGRIEEVTHQLQHGFAIASERYHHTKMALSEHVLTSDSMRDASLVMILVLSAWYVISVLNILSWPYALLVVYAWRQKIVHWPFSAWLSVIGYMLVNLVVTLGFLLERLFFSKRYLIAFSLVLMLWVPFALDKLWQDRANIHKRSFLIVITFFIFISSLGGIFDFGYSKSYIRQAGDWLAQNVPLRATLYANDYQLMYYSKHFGTNIFDNLHQHLELDTIGQGKWQQYDYIALRLDKKKVSADTFLDEMKAQPMKTFSNKRGDVVVIYKVR